MRSVKTRCKGMPRGPMQEHTRCDSLALQFVVIYRFGIYEKAIDVVWQGALSAAGY